MRVVIAEDGALFREGLLLLLTTAGHEVAGSVADGGELLDVLAAQDADVAILDIRMPPGPEGGLRTAQQIRHSYPHVGLLLLSHYAESSYLTRLLEIGTERIGYRLKDKIAGVPVLTDTLTRISSGELVIEPVLARQLVDRPAHRTRSLASLSRRELDVLRLMAEGLSNAGIADTLFLSAKAVEKHIANIFAKLALPGGSAVHHRRVLAVLKYLGVAAP